MSAPIVVVRTVTLVAFVGVPLMAVFGFTMYRYPQAWANMNARSSRKQLHEFDSPKQLAHTKRVGILLVISAAFSFLSMLGLRAVLARLN